MKKKKSSRKRGGFPSPLILGILLLALVFIVWKWKGSRPEPMAAQDLPPSQPQVLSNNDFKQQKKQDQQRSLLLAQERAADLRPLPVKIVDGKIKLQVSSRLFVRRCIASDFDIMERDMKITGRSEPGFVLSLENLDPGSRVKPQQIPLTLDQIKANINHSFEIPQNTKRSTWGVFICTKGDQSCAEQKKLSLAELGPKQAAALYQPAEVARYPKDPKVFFFHFLVAYQDRLLLLDPMQSLDSSFQRLEKALAQAGGEAVSPSLLNEVKQGLRAIGSMPAIVKPGGLEIQMPHQGKDCP
jgi:hypothetical protein